MEKELIRLLRAVSQCLKKQDGEIRGLETLVTLLLGRAGKDTRVHLDGILENCLNTGSEYFDIDPYSRPVLERFMAACKNSDQMAFPAFQKIRNDSPPDQTKQIDEMLKRIIDESSEQGDSPDKK
jgi:hypothetical protein